MERSIGLLKGRWRKLLDIDHLDVIFATKVIMAALCMTILMRAISYQTVVKMMKMMVLMMEEDQE